MDAPKDERSNFDVKSKQCILIRYGQAEFASRCYGCILIEEIYMERSECFEEKGKELMV